MPSCRMISSPHKVNCEVLNYRLLSSESQNLQEEMIYRSPQCSACSLLTVRFWISKS